MDALLVLAGLALMAVGIAWQIGRWLGFWRLLALVGLGEGASAARSLRRQSLAAADLAQELRLLREARINPWGRPSPARQGTSPFDDDESLARVWREETRHAKTRAGRE